MALLAVQKPSAAGAAVSYAAANGGGDSFLNTGRESFHVKNGSGAPITVTFASGSNKCSFGVANAAHDRVVVVGAGADALIGPFDLTQFNDANGHVNVTYSGVTSLTVAVLY